MQKFCRYCNQTKDTSQFNLKNTAKGIYQNRCRSCHNIYAHAHYDANKQMYIDKAARRNIETIATNTSTINTIKSNKGCHFCQENDPCCLDFHHTSDNKERNVAHMKTGSLKSLLREIAKCVVLCSNCHRKLHAGKLSIQ